MERKDFDYFKNSLGAYIAEEYPEKKENIDLFIEERANLAFDNYNEARLEGHSITEAMELGNKMLFKDLHFSKFKFITSIIFDEFENDINSDDAEELAKRFVLEFNHVFDKYNLSDDFDETPEYNSLYNEIVGEVQMRVENGL